MPDLIDEVSKLKNRARIQRKRGGHDKAALTLQRAIDRLKPELEKARAAAGLDDPAKVAAGRVDSADDWEIRIAAELADFYGTLGGTQREQGYLLDAAKAYDAGFKVEADQRYGFVNSYNELNRLIVRILLNKDSLSDPEAFRQEERLDFENVPQSLSDLRKEIARQVAGVRSDDIWAAGDLWFVSLLVGDEEKTTTEAWEDFVKLSPEPYAYDAYLSTIGKIAKLDTPRQQALGNAQALLKTQQGAAGIG